MTARCLQWAGRRRAKRDRRRPGYLALLTGATHASPMPLGVTRRERAAVLTLAALILGGWLVPQPGVTSARTAAGAVLRTRTADAAPAHD